MLCRDDSLMTRPIFMVLKEGIVKRDVQLPGWTAYLPYAPNVTPATPEAPALGLCAHSRIGHFHRPVYSDLILLIYNVFYRTVHHEQEQSYFTSKSQFHYTDLIFDKSS